SEQFRASEAVRQVPRQQPARAAAPDRSLAASRAAPAAHSAASQHEQYRLAVGAERRPGGDSPAAKRPHHTIRRLLRAASLLAVVAGSAWLLLSQYNKLPGQSGLEMAPWGPGASESPPFRVSGDTIGAVDRGFQSASLWRVIKQEFPEWYTQRLNEVAKLKSEQRDDDAVTRYLVEAVVALRRKHAAQALAASPASLRTVATTFLDNLKHLSQHSVEACYGFIAQGEMSAAVLPLLNKPEHPHLQRQTTAVFEAVAEGRKAPLTHLPPRKDDYDALARLLTERGWTQSDLQLFTDPRALARANSEQVCKMVQDWFAAQLSIQEPELQLRLLFESLRPVVAG
ncbi:MAG TPA: hypothetical protein VE665_00855, partial [Hyphomicrobiaceae bacterium]|nr:hypothetical protein [Hyphomicrobiaceae bacterium]